MNARLAAGIILGAALAVGGCVPSHAPQEVVVYAALDQEFSEPILDEFTRQTGIEVRAKYDVESTKTVGLTQALIAEAAQPRCDVFWNNEILNTLRLAERGLLAVYQSPAAAAYPELYRSAEGTWCGFAARARVLLVHRNVPPDERPRRLEELADPRWRARVAIAKPLFGTTATHCACLFAYWGEERAEDYFRGLKRNQVQILSGNRQVAQAVAAGEVAVGLTDTDDAMLALEAGMPVVIVYPDREPDEMGTLFIPNTVSILRGAPHPAEARRLIDYLLSPAVEARLAAMASAQIPLHPAVDVAPRVETPRTVKAMPVDFTAAARQWDRSARFLREEFIREP